jgi:single-stranded-DNA-specific exonuclease
VLNKTKNIGLKSLCEAAEIQMGKIGGYEVGYMIAPRLNAAGRVSIPIKGLELLISEDPNESNAIAQTLNKLNVQRQKLMDEATKDAISQIENEKMYQKNILILKNENWNEGVVGLVAGRIAQKYFRPTIILTQKGKKLKGSARSIPGVDITAALSGAGELLLSYGGHNQAAGLSLREADFSKFCKIMVSLANKIPEKLFSKKLRIDCLISIEKINKSFADKLDKMEPFGNGNPRPIFAFEDVEILQARTMGKDNNHYRLTVGRESRSSECIAFNADKDGWAFKRGQKIDVAFSVKASQWQGVEKIDLIIEDVKEKR